MSDCFKHELRNFDFKEEKSKRLDRWMGEVKAVLLKGIKWILIKQKFTSNPG